MRGEEKTLNEMLKKEDAFVIPVYQRDYNWQKEQCRQLYDDLKSTITHHRKSHFFGSIVDARDPEGGKYTSIIIDGQQRLTTVSILLIAFRSILQKDILKFERRGKDDLIRDIDDLLFNHEKLKLRPAPNSKAAYDALFGNPEEFIKDSNITANFQYFFNRLEENKNEFTADEIWYAIDNLTVVDISLGPEDDAQLIFESINSTGMALSESDKIRNYVMMSLNLKEQERYYNDYWRKIEINTPGRTDLFIRDFLTIQTRTVPNREEIYDAFKAYARNMDKEQLISSMLKFSKYYASIYTPKLVLPPFRKPLQQLRKLEMGVVNPYLMQLFEGYYAKIIPENEVVEAIDVLQDYLFRRKICDVPSNALNKIFTTLHTDAIKLKGNTDDYSERVKYVLMHKESSGRFPKDEEFIERFKTRDIYTSLAEKYKIYLLESLEVFDNREAPDISKLIEEGVCSIEHIMPQTLTPEWIKDLGGEENANRVHETWLHCLGNLTFTGYNSKYSNLPFEKKLTMEHGFQDSTFWLNKYVGSCTKWTEEEIIARSNLLLEKAKKVWPEPHSDFIENVIEEGGVYNLAENYNFTGKSIIGFSFEGKEYSVGTWKDFLIKILQLLYEKDRKPLQDLSVVMATYGPSSYIVSSEHDYDQWKISEIADGIYVYKNCSTWEKLKLLTSILDIYGIPHTAVNIKVKTTGETNHDESRYYRFWERALEVINSQSYVFQNRSPTTDSWLTAGAGIGIGTRYAISFTNVKCTAFFEFNSRFREKNLKLYDYVYDHREEIEQAFGSSLEWHRNEDMRRSSIDVSREDFHIGDENCWDAAAEFLAENIAKLHEVLQPILESYGDK